MILELNKMEIAEAIGFKHMSVIDLVQVPSYDLVLELWGFIVAEKKKSETLQDLQRQKKVIAELKTLLLPNWNNQAEGIFKAQKSQEEGKQLRIKYFKELSELILEFEGKVTKLQEDTGLAPEIFVYSELVKKGHAIQEGSFSYN